MVAVTGQMIGLSRLGPGKDGDKGVYDGSPGRLAPVYCLGTKVL